MIKRRMRVAPNEFLRRSQARNQPMAVFKCTIVGSWMDFTIVEVFLYGVDSGSHRPAFALVLVVLIGSVEVRCAIMTNPFLLFLFLFLFFLRLPY